MALGPPGVWRRASVVVHDGHDYASSTEMELPGVLGVARGVPYDALRVARGAASPRLEALVDGLAWLCMEDARERFELFDGMEMRVGNVLRGPVVKARISRDDATLTLIGEDGVAMEATTDVVVEIGRSNAPSLPNAVTYQLYIPEPSVAKTVSRAHCLLVHEAGRWLLTRHPRRSGAVDRERNRSTWLRLAAGSIHDLTPGARDGMVAVFCEPAHPYLFSGLGDARARLPPPPCTPPPPPPEILPLRSVAPPAPSASCTAPDPSTLAAESLAPSASSPECAAVAAETAERFARSVARAAKSVELALAGSVADVARATEDVRGNVKALQAELLEAWWDLDNTVRERTKVGQSSVEAKLDAILMMLGNLDERVGRLEKAAGDRTSETPAARAPQPKAAALPLPPGLQVSYADRVRAGAVAPS